MVRACIQMKAGSCQISSFKHSKGKTLLSTVTEARREVFVMWMMDTEAGFTGPINLGNPNEFSMLELAEKVLKQVGGSSKLVFHPLPTDGPKQRQPDITLAKNKLSWGPTVQLDDGLKETISYFRKLLSA